MRYLCDNKTSCGDFLYTEWGFVKLQLVLQCQRFTVIVWMSSERVPCDGPYDHVKILSVAIIALSMSKTIAVSVAIYCDKDKNLRLTLRYSNREELILLGFLFNS